ncbi:hypothetical protein NtRootA4_23120 [Arthrobacter sp. NtRootA4]|nr:hypothetical protein NtRootA2_25330 [Arthrobacter sp. NtRootA2]BCW15333.1 hypothetical protein NtRootA4_23120 [Arthrobacter sp. NtRootA4]BCW23668.1 hypothetical protein NtRootC7_25350 [Arthrobacter sp. NtRootC7]BCW27936.1 hypothetical protein NtRootC45_25360 [Arthrobacter sp. NtRootC45]BCW32206.1 hypothetical protein NtRootD5_25370 [Arthrobacter sp. NtRootD5]
MVPVLGSLHAHGVGHSRFRQGDFASGDSDLKAGGYGSREFIGSHGSSLPVARKDAELVGPYVDNPDTAGAQGPQAAATD